MSNFLKQICLFIFPLLVLCHPGLAQTSATPADHTQLEVPQTHEGVRDMMAILSEAEVRALLLSELDAAVVAQTATAEQTTGIASISEAIGKVGAGLERAVLGLPQILPVQMRAIANFQQANGDGDPAYVIAKLAFIILIGLTAEFITRLLLRTWRVPLIEAREQSAGTILTLLLRRLLREIAGLLAFYFFASVTIKLILDPPTAGFATLVIGVLIWMPRICIACSRFLLSPKRPELRLVNIDTAGARSLYRDLTGLFLLVSLVYFVVQFNLANGIRPGESQIGFWLNTLVHVYIGVTAWRNRTGLTKMMLGTDPDPTASDKRIAQSFPYFVILVSGVMWLAVEFVAFAGDPSILKSAPHFVTMFWLLLAPVLDTVIRAVVALLQPPMVGNGPIAEQAHKSANRSLVRIGRVIVLSMLLVLIAHAWQIQLLVPPNREALTFGALIFRFMEVWAIGLVVFEVTSLWINRRLAKENTAQQPLDSEAGGEGGGAGGSRLATVFPLLLKVVQVAIVVIFGLLAIGALGIDITPLLAGAGIIGLAIGFGAQKLVSDVVSGVFFLIDDAFRIGEYVEVEGTMGTVEKISIRSMQLRHHRGSVHTIPYGEIPKLTNYSRDWAIMKLKFTVPFGTDPNKVKKIFKKIGAEMLDDPLFEDDFLEPFKSQGVLEFSDIGIVIRGKFMAKPGRQFTLRKEIFNRVQAEFAAAGIEFARPEVRIAGLGKEHSEIDENSEAAREAAALVAVKHRLEKKIEP